MVITQLERFNNAELNKEILRLSPNDHKRRKYIRSFMTKEFLSELVLERKFTSNFISKKILLPKGYNCHPTKIISFCKEFGIKTNSMKEQANNSNVRNLFKETCLERYGVEHILQKNTEFYKKRNNTVKTKYGVANVFQLEDVKNKSKDTLRKRYGVYCPRHLPWFDKNCGRKSKIHKKVEDYLSECKIKFESEKENQFICFNEYLNRSYSPRVDIFIEYKKIVIEINGDIWHANPTIYKPNDIIKKWHGETVVKDIWEFDHSRIKQIEKFGYKVIVFWETDINKNFEEVKKIINENCKD